jgi:hypothetical protein
VIRLSDVPEFWTWRFPVHTLPRLNLMVSPARNVTLFTLLSDCQGAAEEVPLFESAPLVEST